MTDTHKGMTPTQAGELIADIKRATLDGQATDRLWAISARNTLLQALEHATGSDLLEGLMVSQFLAEEADMHTPDVTPEHLKWAPSAEAQTGMRNLGFCVDPGIEEELRTGNYKCRYAGWNFNGIVWFDRDEFVCQPWTYGIPHEPHRASTLSDLMHSVSGQYGYD